MNEVIIDGCNVAECKLFYNICNENMCARVDGLTCREDDNCYFKQLQRAKAELEQYKKSAVRELKATDKIEFKQYYKAENEKLQEKNKSIAKDYVDVFIDYQKYKQALKEMKEIANHLEEDTGRYNIYDLSKKINEVLND